VTTRSITDDRSLIHVTALAAMMLSAIPTIAPLAQGLDAEGAIDAIVGTDVEEEATRADADPQRVIAAIEKAPESISEIRKTIMLDRLDIVFVQDAALAEGGPPAAVQAALDANADAVSELRTELEGNAMLYHAVNSRQVLMRDVLAVEFEDQRHVTIFVAAPEPSQ
jgi:hypothetical protein